MMASYKGKLILSVWVFVGCVLICTVASDETTRDELIKELDGKLADEVESILQSHREYVNRTDTIQDHSVEELAGFCDESVSKCSRKELAHIEEVGQEYRQTIYSLYKYAFHCSRKLTTYCTERYGEVRNFVLAKISQKDKKLMRKFLVIYRQISKPSDDCFKVYGYFTYQDAAEAYNRLRDSLHVGNHDSDDKDRKLMPRFKKVLGYFEDYYRLFADSIERQPESVPDGSNFVKNAKPVDDSVLVTNWKKLSCIAYNYIEKSKEYA